MAKNIFREMIINRLVSNGYSKYYARLMLQWLKEDIFIYKKTTLKQKIWAYKHGFLSWCLPYYGLDESNYRDYLSPFDYYRLHPINGSYGKWIDDKLTFKHVLFPYSEYLPEYYYHFSRGEILKLMDCPQNLGESIQEVMYFLKQKGALAAKLTAGSFGRGFYKLAYNENQFYINNNISDKNAVEALLHSWLKKGSPEYLITEYLYSHADLRRISGETANPLRIMVIREKNETPKILIAYIEFGTRSLGVVEGIEGIYCRIDLSKGSFANGKVEEFDVVTDCKYHPDTNVLIEGAIPNWNLVAEKIVEISSYIPQVRYMGYDVIITDKGFKIIEINSHQGIMMIQYFTPLLRDGISKTFFTDLMAEKGLRRV